MNPRLPIFIVRSGLLGLLLFGGALVPAQAREPGQDLEKVRLTFPQSEVRIADVFDRVAQESGYSFFYEDNLRSELQRRVRVDRETTAQRALTTVSQQTALEFRTVARTITVRKRRVEAALPGPELPVIAAILPGFAFAAVPLPAQTRRVAGRVTGQADGAGMPGVNVLVKYTQTGTTTDRDGRYALDLRPQDSVLVFSYIGYGRQEVTIGNRSVVDVALTETLETLQEAVVTALGIKRERRSLGFAVGEVTGSSLTTVAQENALGGLMAKVPGVVINQTSGVGSSISVVIRGATSLTTDNQPLFVIDGVPVANSLNNQRQMGDRNQVDYGNAISDLNPDDIETISVLKGPSAAALYGSRAGNGVILVTTKSAKKGKGMGISFSTSNVIEEPVKFLDFHYRYGSGDRNARLDESSAYWAGPTLDQGVTAVQWNSPLDANGNGVPTELRSYRDNMKNFLQTSLTSTNNLALSGSSEKTTYRLSFNNMLHQGLIPGADLHRNGLSAALGFDLNTRLKLTSNLNFVRSNSNNRPATGNRGANALEAVYNWPHVDVRDLRDYWVPGQEGIMQRTPSNEFNNPYFIANALTNAFVRDRVFGNLKLDWAISPAWSAFARASYDWFVENRETKIPWSYTRERRGAYHLQDLARQESNIDFLVTYRKTLGRFNLSLSGGGNIMQQSFRDNYAGSARNAGLIVPGLYRLSNIPNTGLVANNFSSQKAIYSVYGMASIGFRDQVYLDLTGRNDWSSTLPKANRSYFYPSASLSWLANYTFNLPKAISLLKFRSGWAQVGNDTDPYQLSPVLGTGNWGSLIATSVPNTLLNPQLQPEIATSTEGGIDAQLFDNRLRFEVTYYQVEKRNQILRINTPSSSGYDNKLVNAGLLANRGWEIAFGGTPLRNRDGWTLDIMANLTRSRTTVKELADGIDFITLWDDNNGGAFTRVGEDIGNIYSRGFAYVKDPSSPYYRWPILSDEGDWISVNDRDSRVKVGNFNPKFIFGLQTTLSYKRFSLSASFDWRQGGNFQSYTYRYGESDWKSARQERALIPGGLYDTDALATLLKSNPEAYIIPRNGNFPRVGGYTAATGGMGPDGDNGFIPGVVQQADGSFVEHLGGPGTVFFPVTELYPWGFNQQITFDASFIKLRELGLNYSIPKIGGLRNVSFGIYTRNLMLWTASKIGIDPERAFQTMGSKQGDTASQFRQGIELQNVTPWTVPFGFKLNLNL